MVSGLKHTLKSLCCSHGWSFAVFWRYDLRNSMLLTVEEAYHDELTRTVVDGMLRQDHIFGQGIIGEAALTGNHRWMFRDTAKDVFQAEHDLQTVLVVPIGSRGVVQLGSTNKIQKSTEILEQTARALQQTGHISETLDLDELFSTLAPLGSSESLQGLAFDGIFAAGSCSFPSPEPPSCFTSDICEMSGKSHDPFEDDDFGFDILNSYSLDDLQQCLADSPGQNASLSSGSLSPGSFLQDKTLVHWSDGHQETSVVSETDLFDVLGPNFEDSCSTPPKGLFSELISSSFSNSSSSVTNQTHSQDFCLNPAKRKKLETSSPQSSSFFARSCNVMSQTMMQTASFCNPPIKPETFSKPHSGFWSCNFGGNSDSGPSKKPDEAVRKKRAKPGESRKPRPKDRQMIQERIKELRGMIPNAAKCSIDALLDLTTKHVLFMQSVAKHADKLKQTYEPKLVNQKGSSIEEQVAGERNGATWAFEVGDESVVCPIIVEDLNPPGHLQIEMICEESGQFLEIADLIRGFGLNILKGAMETRHGRIWAHFITEGRVERVQVLWSLVQHLQQEHPLH
ncbi:PREDICTED: transcription factor bHLH157-like [Tarenaya hassleriana]|uniref:transcription factor bHLH157-like n=1 Tax=Tarenaya hassleriana TaxID=28532 RepID=UPI00053C1AA6|nr:PREDICTED: transcription factor bHLH157-like [Tarenaya hassleriana]XP_010544940.1 PREDICTED: transcription factor bHLH157-like [Tarenaya hassleriana]